MSVMTEAEIDETMFRLHQGCTRVAELTASNLRREEFIAGVLAAMRDAGFDRARHYEVTTDAAIGESVAILVQEDDPDGERSGLKVRLREATLAVGETISPRPVVTRAYGDERDADWVAPLGLAERAWVEIPVTAGTEMLGILACDWIRSRRMRLSEEDCELLRVIGALVGSYLGLKPIALLNAYREAREQWPVEDPVALVRSALPHLSAAVDAAAAAVFEFNWTDQTLTKIDEHIAPALQSRAAQLGQLEEQYGVRDYLTGTAWAQEDLHHIVSFDSIVRHQHNQVAPESLRWHTELLGEVCSIIYAVVGGIERRFLLRFINRASRPAVPFVYAKPALDTLVSELRSDIDSAVTTQRSDALEGMAALAAETNELGQLLTEVGRRLAAESVANFAVVCHHHQVSEFKLIAFVGSRLGRVELNPDAPWRDDGLYLRARTTMEPSVERLRERGRPQSLSGILRQRGFRAALTIPMESGSTLGILIVPLDAVPTSGAPPGSRGIPGLGYGTTSLLLAHARLIANALEAADARARADSAIRALGLMGHEVRGPIARLESAAEESIEAAILVAQDLDPIDPKRSAELAEQMQVHERAFREALRAVDVALELAPFVVNDSARLELIYQEVNLLALLEAAAEDVEEELRQEKNPRSYHFDFKASAERLTDLNDPDDDNPQGLPVRADKDHITSAFKNLLRNAAKYSLPRQPGQPMLIEVMGEPQTEFVAVKVRNWGHGIPPQRRHLIFDPWVRGEVNDKLKAIGGMGLGLHLAKHMVAAHLGEIRVSSIATLDDPSRTRELEGFETTFELRVRRGLKPGKHVYHQDGRLDGPSTE